MSISGAETQSVVVEREIAHAPEKIWRALTQGHLIAEWLMANDFQPVVGHRFNLRAAPQPHWNGVVDCEVLSIDPGRVLSYRWDASGAEAETGIKSVVTWTLIPTPDGTLVRMEQSGFRQQDNFNRQGAEYGWRHFLAGLERVTGEQGD